MLGVLWHPEEDQRSRVIGSLVERARARRGSAARMIQVIEPATAEVMAEVPRAGAEDMDAAVERARAGFPDGAPWLPPSERAASRAGRRAGGAAGGAGPLEARNAGKPIGDARGEMGMVVDTFRYYAAARPSVLPGRRSRWRAGWT